MDEKSWKHILLFILGTYSLVYFSRIPVLKGVADLTEDAKQQVEIDKEMVKRSELNCESYFTKENAISVIQRSWKKGDLKDVLLANRKEFDAYAIKLPDRCGFTVVVRKSGANAQVEFKVTFSGEKKAFIRYKAGTRSSGGFHGTWE